VPLRAEPELDAGSFAAWLAAMTTAIAGEGDADVPCHGCTACCRSAQFVHVGPDETDTIAHIPRALLFPAPRQPGHFVLGYDERGHCPMLVDDQCSIYAHRPRACRTYDCRVFPASGVDVEPADQPDLARRVRRWRFRYEGSGDGAQHEAVRAAAAFLRDHAGDLPEGAVPRNGAQRAALAVGLHSMFLSAGAVVEPDVSAVRVELTRR
jgi:uncharacterized protein